MESMEKGSIKIGTPLFMFYSWIMIGWMKFMNYSLDKSQKRANFVGKSIFYL